MAIEPKTTPDQSRCGTSARKPNGESGFRVAHRAAKVQAKTTAKKMAGVMTLLERKIPHASRLRELQHQRQVGAGQTDEAGDNHHPAGSGISVKRRENPQAGPATQRSPRSGEEQRTRKKAGHAAS